MHGEFEFVTDQVLANKSETWFEFVLCFDSSALLSFGSCVKNSLLRKASKVVFFFR